MHSVTTSVLNTLKQCVANNGGYTFNDVTSAVEAALAKSGIRRTSFVVGQIYSNDGSAYLGNATFLGEVNGATYWHSGSRFYMVNSEFYLTNVSQLGLPSTIANAFNALRSGASLMGHGGNVVGVGNALLFFANDEYNYYYDASGKRIFVWNKSTSQLTHHLLVTWLTNNTHDARRAFVDRFGTPTLSLS